MNGRCKQTGSDTGQSPIYTLTTWTALRNVWIHQFARRQEQQVSNKSCYGIRLTKLAVRKKQTIKFHIRKGAENQKWLTLFIFHNQTLFHEPLPLLWLSHYTHIPIYHLSLFIPSQLMRHATARQRRGIQMNRPFNPSAARYIITSLNDSNSQPCRRRGEHSLRENVNPDEI